MSSPYSLIVGMEVHVELKTKSKMFCSCKNDPFGAPKPNMYTCPVCLGMPGGLPVANKQAIEWTLKLGLALGCEISLFSKFDRKHYFYPDLPKGYQISQYDEPFCTQGKIETEFGTVRIHRVHLEEDTGKLQHRTMNGRPLTLIDFNRSSVPLVEIVTEPDIHSAEQAKAYGQALRDIVRTLGISDADMEKGSMRLEANISCTTDPNVLPDYKVEVKNINSFRFLEQAIIFEQARHVKLLQVGTKPKQETRGWNEVKNETIPQRSKENAEDYRYFPDPDLPPLVFTPEWVAELRTSLPELPAARLRRYEKLGIRSQFAKILAGVGVPSKVVDKVLDLATKQKISTDQIASLIVNKKLDLQKVSAKEVLELAQVQLSKENISETELNLIIAEILSENDKAVKEYKAGKQQVLGFLVGMAIKKINRKVNVESVRTALLAKLK